MRTVAIVVAVIVILFLIAVLVVPPFVNLDKHHARIQAELQKALGRPVSFTHIHASLLPPSVRLDDFSIAEDPRFGAGPFAAAKQIVVALNPWPLLHKEIDIRSLRLDNPRLELIADPAGTWNFSTLGQHKTGTSSQQYELADLRISDGQLMLNDQQKNMSATYDHIDLGLKHFAPGKPFDITAALHLPGKGNEKLQVSGWAGPIPQNGASGTLPFTGKATLDQVSLADLASVAPQVGLQGTQGIASGWLDVKSDNGSIASSGSLKLDQPKIRGVDLGYSITLDYNLSDNTNTGEINIEKGTMHLGPTPLSIAGKIESKGTPMQVDVSISTSNASISEAARLAAAFGTAFQAQTQVSGNLNADIHATGEVNSPQINGTLSATNLAISGGSIKAPVQVAKLDLTLSPSTIHAAPFTAKSGGTSVDAEFTLANYTSDSPNIQATVKTAKANIEDVLSMARAYGFSEANSMNASGMLTLDLTASGPLKNTSAMTFSGSGQLQNASIKTASLAKPINIKNANLRFNQNSMLLDNLSASVDDSNATGSMTVRNFAAPQVQFTLAADKVNVAALQQLTATAPPARPSASAKPANVPARAGASPQTSPLETVTGSGNVTIGTLSYDQLVLTGVKSQVALDHGVIRLSPLSASLYNGQETGDMVLDTRVNPMSVAVTSNLQHIDADQLVSAVSNVKHTIYGLLSANANTHFEAQNAAEIARTLTGTASLNLANGKIAQMDILNQLSSIGRFVQGAASAPKPYTDVVKLAGNFNVTNGLAQTDNLTLEIPGATLAAKGSVNLVNEGLDMHVTAVLSQDFSQKVGGTQIGGFMQTALANNKGELVLPVLITGTFGSPHFAPDMEEVARLKLQNLLPSFNNPGQATAGILGALLNGKEVGANRGLGGVLDQLTGKKPAQQQAQPQQQPQQQQPPQNPLNQLLNLGKKKKP